MWAGAANQGGVQLSISYSPAKPRLTYESLMPSPPCSSSMTIVACDGGRCRAASRSVGLRA